MLKKRILASSMASVMALTSISAVAFADDTAETYGNKSVADLKAYIESDAIKQYVGSKDYNATKTANFNDAYRYAQNVVNGKIESEATAAYRMMAAVAAQMNYWTLDQLNALIADTKALLLDSNKLEGGDGQDLRFESGAYNNAKSKVSAAETIAKNNQNDKRKIDNAYENLKAAYDALVGAELKVVYKSDFKAIYDQVNDLMVNNKQKYDAWTRIKIKDSGVTGYDGFTVAYGNFYKHMTDVFTSITTKYKPFSDKTIDRTTNADIRAAYAATEDAYKVLNAVINDCTPIGESIAFKGDVENLIGVGGVYHKRLAYDYAATAVATLLSRAASAGTITVKNGDNWDAYVGGTHTAAKTASTTTGFYNGWELNFNNGVLADADLTIKFGTAAYVVYNADGSIKEFAASAAGATVNTNLREYGQPIAVGEEFNLAEKVSLTSLKSVALDASDNVDPNGVIDSATGEACPYNSCGGGITLGHLYNGGSNGIHNVAVSLSSTNGKIFESDANATTTVSLSKILPIAQSYLEDIVSVAANGSAAEDADATGSLIGTSYTFTAANATADEDATLTVALISGSATLATIDGEGVATGVTVGDYGLTVSTALSKGDIGRTITLSYDGSDYSATASGSGSTWTLTGYDAAAKADDAGDDELTKPVQGTDIVLTCALGTDENGDSVAVFTDAGGDEVDLADYGISATASIGDIGKTITFTAAKAAVPAASAESAKMSVTTGLILDTNGADVVGGYKKMLLDATIDTNGSWLQQLPGNPNLYKEEAGKRTDILWEEWTDIYNYLNYALSDKYTDPAAVADLKTRDDVGILIGQMKALEAVTYNVPMFTEAYKNAMNARQDAEKWMSATDLASYKDNDLINGIGVVKDATFFITDSDTKVNLVSGSNANALWYKLKANFDVLDNLNKRFNLSYKTIADKIVEASEKYDEKNNEALKAAIDDCAFALSVAKKDTSEQWAPFSNSRNFNANDRVDSWAGAGTTQRKLVDAYNALKKIVDRQMGDVNGDGKINPLDAVLVLKHFAELETLSDEQKAYADLNDDGKYNAVDAREILKIFAGL